VDRKVLETFFRHVWQVLLPAALVPLLVIPGYLWLVPPQFESQAGIWADYPAYVKSSEDATRVTTAAQMQGNRLAELLRTRSFRDDVAKRTALASLVDTPEGEARLERLFKRNATIAPNGDHLLIVRYRAETPQLAYEVVNALLAAFKDRVAQERAVQAKTAVTFYEAYADQLQQAKDFLQLDKIRNALQQARYDAAAAELGQELGFRLTDPPEVPTARTRILERGFIVAVIISLVTGTTLSGLLLLLLVRVNNLVHSPNDLGGAGGAIPVVGAVPFVPGLALQPISR
jgi:hypothetical protein